MEKAGQLIKQIQELVRLSQSEPSMGLRCFKHRCKLQVQINEEIRKICTKAEAYDSLMKRK